MNTANQKPKSFGKLAGWLSAAVATLALWISALPITAQVLDENCTATILNRSVQVGPGGTIGVNNVPVQPGYFRVRVTCTSGGVTSLGQSGYFVLNPTGTTVIGPITFGQISPQPISVAITSPTNTLFVKGQTVQLAATLTFANGSITNAPGPSQGTLWLSSNPNIASIGSNGLVTAVSRGTAIIQVINEGVQSSLELTMLIPNDADNDGMTDEFERANGLNPNNAGDAGQDPDGDGLTNLQEFQRGTNPRSADTDGDGLTDGQEVALGTNPLLADTDGDGLTDGQEVLRGSNPVAGDTDGDGIADGLEVQLGLNLTNADLVTRVEGRVVDTSNAPVAGAAVTLFNLLTANSDNAGFFSIPNVPAGLGTLTVVAQTVRVGQILDGESAPISPVANGLTSVGTIQIGLNAGTVAGVITDPFGAPVPGGLVTVTAGADLRTATADPLGRYRISNMTAGGVAVTARDYRTGLRGRALSVLPLNGSVVINVQLGPFGTVRGTVLNRDNTTPVGAGVDVDFSGPNFQQTDTDPFGQYLFDFVPIGSYTLNATDTLGNRGRSGGDVSATAQVNVNDIAYLGRGQVVGVVRDAALNPVANAALNLNSGSVFNGNASTTSDGAGRYSFSNVFIGSFFITAQSPVTHLAGQTSGSILSDGQRVTNNITVAAAGSITGLVFRADGVTPVTNVQVTVSPAGLSTTSGAQGQFGFAFLPLGTYTLNATDPATGDRGGATASITAQDEVQTANIVLNGLGTVTVTVRDGASNLVSGAQVQLNGTTQFGGSQSGVTATNGMVTFSGVLAGGFNVSATDPATGFGGQVSGNVGVGGTVLLTVRLQSFGSIAGIVFQPDGTTPAAGITVNIFGQVSRNTTTAANGSYRFDIVPTSTYTVQASDSGGLRASAGGVVVSTQGQIVQRNLTMIGLGTVRGLVSNPGPSPAANVGVSLVSQSPGFGRSFFAQTDINGLYSVGGVPVGPFTATSSGQSGNTSYFGTTSGVVTVHAEVVTANIQLQTSSIPVVVTTTLYDANNFGYQLRENGSLQDGSPGSMWGGDFGANRGAFLLDLIVSGATNRFAGQASGLSEEGGREIAIQQNGLGGLNVTRKVFVPRDGYFVRYLEVLSNPSGSSITVGVQLISHFRFISKVQGGFTFQREPRIVSTSSGDAILSVTNVGTRDRWVVIDDDEDADPFLVGSSLPTVGDVFDGPGAAIQTGAAQYDIDFNARYGKLVQNWANITVPAGGTVTLMHFGFEQITRGTALASAQRLLQLPPEALAGMTLTEMGQVLNFALPPGGVSVLPALPPLNGTINGRTLAGDGSNIVANATVRYRSTNSIFGRTWTFSSSGAGEFGFTGAVTGNGNSVPVPVDGFTLVGVHPFTGIATAPIPGSFPPGLLVTTRDVIFADTGGLTGTVRRHNNVVVSSGTVTVSGGGLLNPITLGITANGKFGVSGLPAGLYTLVATTPVVQGSDLSAAATATITAGQTTTADLLMPPTGIITGLVRRQDNSPGVDVGVQLHGTNNLSRGTSTDTGGRFTFFDVPVGPVTLDAFDPLSNTSARGQTNAVVDQTIAVTMTLISGGTVAGLVTSPSSQPVTNAQVTLIANNGTFTLATGADGRYSFFPVEPGPVSVRAVDPLTSLRGFNSGNLNQSGTTLTLNMQLFNSGSITGIVYRADGVTPISNAPVTLTGSAFRSTTANAQGQYLFDVVPLGSFTVTGSNPVNNEIGSANGSLTANLEVRRADIVVRPNIRISDAAGVVERNVGATQAVFNVTLSSPSAQEVRANFDTTSGSAVVGDFVSTSGTLIFSAGVTSRPVNVTINGDTVVEPSETFFVNLSSAVNGTITDSTGTGTIINDDGFGGRVDHFVWNPIPPAQFVNESFPVTITAQDAFNSTVTDFQGPVTLTGTVSAQEVTMGAGDVSWNFPLASFYHDARLQSIYLAGEIGPARSINGLALDVTGIPGQVLNNWTIRIKHTAMTSYGLNPGWDSSGWTIVLQTNLTISGTGWVVLPFSSAFNYNGVDNLLIDFSFNNNFYTSDGSTRSTDTALNRSLYYRTDSGAGDPLSWSGSSPPPAVITRVPNVRLIGSQAAVAITPGVSGTFAGGVWSGNVTVQQLATNLVLRANDGDGHVGNSGAFDVLVHNDLSLTMTDAPDPVPVGGQVTYLLTVTNTGPNSATGVIVSNILPATATFVSAVSSQGTCSNNAGVVRCVLGVVAGGGNATITIVAAPTIVGNITNRASVSRGEADPNPGNDTVQVVTTVLVPSLTIDDVSAPEGNSSAGAPAFAFTVRLSYPNSQNVTVNYATSNGTAFAASDYVPTNGTLTFLAGETNKTILVRMIGDTVVEPNETFFVNLSNSVNATLADNQAVGTIVNDDGLPGQIDHFDWAAIPSPQYANEAFPVTVTAKDGAGTTVSNFAGPVTLAGFSGISFTNSILTNVVATGSSSGNYTMGFAFTPNTNLTVTHVRHLFGTKVSIWTDTGVLLASQPVVSTPGTWLETPLTTPVQLQAGVRYRVGAYTGSGAGAWYYLNNPPANFAYGSIHSGYYSSGDFFPGNQVNGTAYLADLRYTVGAQVSIPLTPSVSAAFTNGVWTGNVTLSTLTNQPSTNVVLRAADNDGHSGNSASFTMLYRNDIGVSVTDSPDPVGSGATLTYSVRVTNTGPTSATAVTVTNLLPSSVTYGSANVSQGSTSRNGQTVTWTVGTLSGGSGATMTILVTPTASGTITDIAGVTRGEADAFAGNNTAQQTTTVLLPTLTIGDINVTEGNTGLRDAVFQVDLSYPSSQTVTVTYATTNGVALAGSDYVATNGSLTFSPGQTNKTIVVKIIGDTAIELNESFLVKLSNPFNATLTVTQATCLILNDDGLPGDLDHFVWAVIPSPQSVNVPFPVTVTAKDFLGDTVSGFTGTVTLSGAIGGTAITNRILGDLIHSSVGSGNFTLGYAFTPNTNITVTHVRHYGGTKVSIWTDTGTLLASQSVASSPGTWVETPLTTPVALTNGTRYRVAAYTGGGNYYYRNDGALTFPNGTIDQSYEASGDAFPTTPDSTHWWFVDLRYTIGTSTPVPISPTVSGSFVGGAWAGQVAVQGLGANLILRAADADGHVGDANPISVIVQNDLSVGVTAAPDPADVRSNLTYTVYVTNSGPSSASGVTVSNLLPVEVNFISAVASQGSPTTAGRLVTCNLGTMAGGAVATVTIVVKPVLDAIVLTNACNIGRADVDPFAGNNAVTVFTPVRGLLGGGGGKVAIYAADNSSNYSDVRNKVQSAGLFAQVDVFSVVSGNPTLGDLAQYDAVLTYANNGYNDSTAFGNALADYVDNGGGVVVAVFAFDTSSTLGIQGRLASGNYLPFTRAGSTTASSLTLVKDDPQHPILNGVNSFNGGSSSFHDTVNLASGATLIAHWSNSRPLVGVRQTAGGRVAGLNFFPPSSTASSGFWVASTDGGRLMANALAWTTPGSLIVPDDLALIVADTPDPVGVGGNLTYTLTVTNTGPSTATSVVVSNVVPAGANLISFNSSQGTSSNANGVIVCGLGTVPAGTNATVTVIVQAPLTVGTLTNVANIVRAEPDGYLRNNRIVSLTAVQVPAISVDDITLNEGNSGTTNANFLVRLSPAAAQVVSVRYSTANSSALAGSDYIATTNGLVIFNPGQTTQTVTVPVIGDLLDENDESFFVNLSNPTNATLLDNSALGTIVDDDPLPVLTINDVSLVERNVGTTNAVFTVTLSAPSGRAVSLNYAAANDTALAGTDYVPTNGFLSFIAGETNKTIVVPVIGETRVETNETFFVNLSSVANATLGDSQGVGTIVNDDGIAGQIDHFDWAAIPSPQFVNQSFLVNITAKDAFGTTLVTFAGPVALNGIAGLQESVNTILGDVVHSQFFNGTYTVGYSFTPSTNLVVTHVRHYAGTKVSIWTDAGILIASQPVGGTAGVWTETPLPEPVQLQAGVRYRVGVYNGAGTGNYYRSTLQPTFAYGTIHNAYYFFGDGFPNSSDSVQYLVDLKYALGTSTTVPISPTVSGTFTSGVWSGQLTVQAPAQDLVLRADDGDGHAGKADKITVLLTNDLSVAAVDNPDPADVRSNLTYTITVTNAGPITSTGVTVTNLLPAQVYLQNVTVSQGSFATAGGVVTCNLGTLAAGASATVTIVTRPHADGFITNTVTVRRLEVESYLANNTATVVTRVLPPPFAGEFQIVNLLTNGSTIVDHNSLTSDDKGGIAVSPTQVFITGDNATARFNVGDLSGGVALAPPEYDSMVGDLRSQKIYLLGNGTTVINENGGTVTTLLELDDNTGALTGNSIALSKPISLPDDGDVGIFSGYGRVVLHSTTNVYNIDLPSGVVTDLGVMAIPPHEYSESWAYWGVAENFGGSVYLTYARDDERTIERMRVPDGATNTVATFTAFSDMASFTVSVPQNRWYFHYEGSGPFGGVSETLGYANATFSLTGSSGLADDIALTVTDAPDPVSVGSNVTYTLTVSNSGPSAATGVVVSNVVPAGANLMSFNSSQGGISNANGVIVCGLGTVPPATNVTMTIVVQTLAVGTLTNVANVVRAAPDAYTPNNRAVNLTAVAVPTLSVDDVTLAEGNSGTTNANFIVRLSLATPQTVSVNYATSDGSALAGSDYRATNGTVIFNPGQTTQTVSVAVIGDNLSEFNETFFVTLTNSANATLFDNSALGTIVNDDPLPVLTIGDTNIVEGNTGTNNAAFVVTLSAPSGRTVTVNYATGNDTALAGSDYIATNGFLSFFASETNKTIIVPVIGDTNIETNETFFVNLSSAGGATIGDSQGVGTISNDDGIAGQMAQASLLLSVPAVGMIELQLNGLDGGTCVIETSTDLRTWQPLCTNSVSGKRAVITDPDAIKAPQRFYRARWQP